MQKTVKRGLVVAFCAFVLLFGALIPTLTVSARADEVKRYQDDSLISTYAVDSEIVYYTNRTLEDNTTVNKAPDYYANTDLENSCGPTAGGIVVGFYDRYFENLIPDYTVYYTATGKYKPRDSVYIPALMQNLYTLMRCNVDDVGVSESDCKSGLQTYVQQHGYKLNYTSIKNSAGTFQMSTVQNAIDNNKVILLFCANAELVTVSYGDGYDKAISLAVQNNHVMVAFGYCTYKYYDSNNVNFRTDTYLVVSSGFMSPSMGFVKVNDTSWLDNGYVVTISN